MRRAASRARQKDLRCCSVCFGAAQRDPLPTVEPADDSGQRSRRRRSGEAEVSLTLPSRALVVDPRRPRRRRLDVKP